ncbi:MAG: thymidine kinase [Clostridium sp.]
MSKLYFRYGAMNCGKSTNLLQVAHNYEERGMKVVVLKPKIDTKGNDKVVSRLGISREVDILISEEDNIYESLIEYKTNNGESHCILVDEVQFLKTKQIDELLEVVVKLDVPVICYGLRTDFLAEGFEGSTRLLLIAHSLEELKTICKCGKKGIFNGRIINGEVVFNGNQVLIDNGDAVEYKSVCAECYLKYKDMYFSKKKI